MVLAWRLCCSSHVERLCILCMVELRSRSLFSNAPAEKGFMGDADNDAIVCGVDPVISDCAMDSFLYFGYGSNLCKQRLGESCPSAELVCVGKARDYQLRFFNLRDVQSRWHGATATIRRERGAVTWGAVWRISRAFSDDLDRLVLY